PLGGEFPTRSGVDQDDAIRDSDQDGLQREGESSALIESVLDELPTAFLARVGEHRFGLVRRVPIKEDRTPHRADIEGPATARSHPTSPGILGLTIRRGGRHSAPEGSRIGARNRPSTRPMSGTVGVRCYRARVPIRWNVISVVPSGCGWMSTSPRTLRK